MTDLLIILITSLNIVTWHTHYCWVRLIFVRKLSYNKFMSSSWKLIILSIYFLPIFILIVIFFCIFLWIVRAIVLKDGSIWFCVFIAADFVPGVLNPPRVMLKFYNSSYLILASSTRFCYLSYISSVYTASIVKSVGFYIGESA